MPSPPFLTAEWRNLIMMNYLTHPDLLKKFIPRGTELDLFEGQCLISVVGFQFLNTKVRGWSIPFHRHFEEVNLRFYVRPIEAPEQRGVVFIKEIVPRLAIAKVARWFYNEPYISMKMAHQISPQKVEYRWGQSNQMCCEYAGKPHSLEIGSEEEFIAEHYWGFTAQKDGGTISYEVQHPPWHIYKVQGFSFHCDIENIYGKSFKDTLQQKPHSVFLAEGSKVSVFPGNRLAVT